MIYVKVNEQSYPASITGKVEDKLWDGRESKEITMENDFDTVDALFQDGVAWSIVNEFESEMRVEVPRVDENGEPVLDENGNQIVDFETQKVTHTEEFDNSDFNIRGDLTVHVDGTCTVKMGKPTDLEDAYEIMYGGI